MGSNNDEVLDIEREQVLALPEARDLLDIVYLINSLFKNCGNVTRVAEELDVGRRTIYDLMKKHGISCVDGKLTIELKPFFRYVEIRAPNIEKYIS